VRKAGRKRRTDIAGSRRQGYVGKKGSRQKRHVAVCRVW